MALTESQKAARAATKKLDEDAFDALIATIVTKDSHVQKEVVMGIGKGRPRYYTVTTFSAGQSYGADRTPLVCSSFERATQAVEANAGDLWEYSYDLVVVSAFYMDCQYGTPWVRKDEITLETGEVVFFENRHTIVSEQDLEQEEYWYVWKFDEGQPASEGRYVPCYRPDNFQKCGPIG